MVRLEQLLKDERIKRKLTIKEVAIATKIKPQFLEQIENGEYSKLPSPAYAQGFVRNYAEYLGLSRVQTAALFKRDFDEKRAVKVLPEGMTQSHDFPLKRISLRRIMLGAILFLILLGFFLFQTRDMFIAPSIFIKSPKEGSTVAQEIDVVGKTDGNAIVTINNDPVFVQSNGSFDKKINLFPGKTSIVIKAKNRKGRETVKVINLAVKQ